MSILFASTADSANDWADALNEYGLPTPLKVWPDTGDLDAVEYAVVAKPPPGLLASLPNLQAILSLWAGVDHITSDPDWPRHIPIYRMVEPGLTLGMVEFVLSQVLNLHLGNYDFLDNARKRVWNNAMRGPYGLEPLVGDRTVGILGLGEMGGNVAKGLVRAGFPVLGWARSRKSIDGVECLAGPDGFDDILARSEILVNLLPLTPATDGILNATSFAKMRAGAALINVGRGQHIIDGDLVDALDRGHLSRAVLDVFRVEPLPDDHPFWTHPKTIIYPHVGSITRIGSGTAALAASIQKLLDGGAPDGLFDPDRGY